MHLVYSSKEIWPFQLLGNRRAITKAANGMFYVFDPLDVSIGQHMLLRGDHEFWLAPVLQYLLRPGDFVIDVGSNIGFHSVVMASLVNVHGRVYCCEPNIELHEFLHRNLVLNGVRGSTVLINKAICDVDGAEVDFHLFHDNCGGNSTVLLPCNEQQLERTVKVQTTTVKAMMAYHPIKLLKIDAEGAEAKILNGARGCAIENYIIENNKDYYTPELDDEVDYLRSLGKICIPLSETITRETYSGKMKDLFCCDVWIH